MESKIENPFTTKVAARLAGEDIQPGDYITVLNEIVELPSYLWNCSDTSLPADELVRLVYKPPESGQPFQVVATCLPFVYVETWEGESCIFDTRQHQLVRLDHDGSRKLWKRQRRRKKEKKKKRK